MIHFHLATGVLASLLIAAAIIDVRTLRIPDPLNALIVASGLAATWALGVSLTPSLIGVAAGYGSLFAVSWGYRALRGRDGLGLGDAKLLAGAGAWLGWQPLAFVVLMAAAMGLAYVAFERVRGRTFGAAHAMAFGPFLCIATFVGWLASAYA